MERCRILVIDSIHTSPGLQQQLCHRIVSIVASEMERCELIGRDSIHTSPGLQQQL